MDADGHLILVSFGEIVPFQNAGYGEFGSQMHHVLNLWEIGLLLQAVIMSLAVGTLLGILYIAVEPQVRRRWPQILVSWMRLLAGEWRDPLVARDSIAGCGFGILFGCVVAASVYIIPSLFGFLAPAPYFWPINIDTALGVRFFISGLIEELIVCVYWNLGGISLLLFLRIILRNQKVAAAAWIIVWTITWSVDRPWQFAPLLVLSILWYLFLMRFGLLGSILILFTIDIYRFSMTLDLSAW